MPQLHLLAPTTDLPASIQLTLSASPLSTRSHLPLPGPGECHVHADHLPQRRRNGVPCWCLHLKRRWQRRLQSQRRDGCLRNVPTDRRTPDRDGEYL